MGAVASNFITDPVRREAVIKFMVYLSRYIDPTMRASPFNPFRNQHFDVQAVFTPAGYDETDATLFLTTIDSCLANANSSPENRLPIANEWQELMLAYGLSIFHWQH